MAITRDSLLTLEQYAKERGAFRARVIAHKRNRTIRLGHHVSLLFEDELTVRYQIQEMLRIERVFEESGIEEELSAYGPLVPDGTNWKATMMLEYSEPEERRVALSALIGIEERVWVRVGGHSPVYAVADEDLDRGGAEKTSAVHFLRFELDARMMVAVHEEAVVSIGVDHPRYAAIIESLPSETRLSLALDLGR
jgi:glycerol-3-phosphate dehydrogenase subunit C